MTRVQGDLKIITGTAEAVTEVWVRSKVSRPVSGGWLMTTNDRKPVFDGKVDLELLPGACVLVAVSSGLPGETVELIVPESGTASLEACIRAAEAAGDLERDALDELRRDIGALIDEARASLATADSSAKAAKAEADKAKGSADAAGKSATAAASSASAAKTSADNAGKSASAADGSATAADKARSDASSFANSAKTASESATSSAQSAADSASAAKADASKASTSATGASDSAKAAKADADRAKVSADSASTSASGAKGSADAAKASADAAGKSATAAASSASAAKTDAGKAATSATEASNSAKSAKADADRAATIASSTSWDGDKLTVNGKTSPSLTGPRGEKGDPGDASKATDTTFGSIKLAGDLGGTSDEPRVVSPLSGSIIPFEGDRQSWAVASGLEKTVDGDVPPGTYYTLTKNTVFDERAFRVTPGVPYYFAVWVKSDKPGQRTYLEVRKHDDLGTQSLSVESGTIGVSDASYFIGDAEVPTEWTLWETVIRFKPSASKLVIGRWYPNHSRGSERNAQLMVGDIMLTPLSPDLEARKSVAEIQGLAANAVGNEVNKITRNGSANQLVKTGTDGSIWIQTVAVTDQHHAANKAYVDGAVSGKADATHTHTLADVTNAPNSHTSAASANTLVSRDSAGRAQFATPTSTGHAATKGYVDSAVQPLAKGAFELRVASSAPPSGTASNVITFVKE